MDELNNNNNNPFDEQKPDDTPTDPYGQPVGQNPYNQPAGQDPYNMPAGQDPYNQPAGQNPYNMPQNPYAQGANPYAQQQGQAQQGNPYSQQGNPYAQQPGQGNPYSQQSGNPYGQPAGQSPYSMPGVQGGQYAQYNQNQYAAYGQQAYAQYQPYQNQSTGMAVASLVLGIISIVLSLFVFSAPILILLPIIGLVLGIVFKSKHLPVGRGLSTAGIITSICGLIFPILILLLMAVLLMNHSLDGIMSEMLRQIKQTDPETYKQFYEMFGESFPEWFENLLFIIGLK
ncbi:MAG: hypothetical protein J1F11_12040 [Oscillospiraceae bacterium]|nr:hypothetical protein [Oscillospiraceae bacterium]